MKGRTAISAVTQARRSIMEDYAWLCINERIGNVLNSAMEGVSRGVSAGDAGLIRF
jgi:hypothetical protein